MIREKEIQALDAVKEDIHIDPKEADFVRTPDEAQNISPQLIDYVTTARKIHECNRRMGQQPQARKRLRKPNRPTQRTKRLPKANNPPNRPLPIPPAINSKPGHLHPSHLARRRRRSRAPSSAPGTQRRVYPTRNRPPQTYRPSTKCSHPHCWT